MFPIFLLNSIQTASTCQVEVVPVRIAAGRDIRPEEVVLPVAASAAGRTVPDRDTGLLEAGHRSLAGLVEAHRILAEVDRRSHLVGEDHHSLAVLEEARHSPVEVHRNLAEGGLRSLAGEGRHNLLVEVRHNRRLGDGWSSHPWSRSCGRLRRGAA